jgi:hypothetical protein
MTSAYTYLCTAQEAVTFLQQYKPLITRSHKHIRKNAIEFHNISRKNNKKQNVVPDLRIHSLHTSKVLARLASPRSLPLFGLADRSRKQNFDHPTKQFRTGSKPPTAIRLLIQETGKRNKERAILHGSDTRGHGQHKS